MTVARVNNEVEADEIPPANNLSAAHQLLMAGQGQANKLAGSLQLPQCCQSLATCCESAGCNRVSEGDAAYAQHTHTFR